MKIALSSMLSSWYDNISLYFCLKLYKKIIKRYSMKYMELYRGFEDVFFGTLSSKINKLNERCYMKEISENIL